MYYYLAWLGCLVVPLIAFLTKLANWKEVKIWATQLVHSERWGNPGDHHLTPLLEDFFRFKCVLADSCIWMV